MTYHCLFEQSGTFKNVIKISLYRKQQTKNTGVQKNDRV